MNGYELELQGVDSGCDIAKTAFHFAENAIGPNDPAVILGPLCEDPVRLIGRTIHVSQKSNIIAVTYGARRAGTSDSHVQECLSYSFSLK